MIDPPTQAGGAADGAAPAPAAAAAAAAEAAAAAASGAAAAVAAVELDPEKAAKKVRQSERHKRSTWMRQITVHGRRRKKGEALG